MTNDNYPYADDRIINALKEKDILPEEAIRACQTVGMGPNVSNACISLDLCPGTPVIAAEYRGETDNRTADDIFKEIGGYGIPLSKGKYINAANIYTAVATVSPVLDHSPTGGFTTMRLFLKPQE